MILALLAYKVIVKEDRKSMTITYFTRSHALTVISTENFYEVWATEIKGQVNDTIIIKGLFEEVRLSGTINYKTIFNYLDGKYPNSIYIIPHKATSGKLKVRHGFY